MSSKKEKTARRSSPHSPHLPDLPLRREQSAAEQSTPSPAPRSRRPSELQAPFPQPSYRSVLEPRPPRGHRTVSAPSPLRISHVVPTDDGPATSHPDSRQQWLQVVQDEPSEEVEAELQRRPPQTPHRQSFAPVTSPESMPSSERRPGFPRRVSFSPLVQQITRRRSRESSNQSNMSSPIPERLPTVAEDAVSEESVDPPRTIRRKFSASSGDSGSQSGSPGSSGSRIGFRRRLRRIASRRSITDEPEKVDSSHMTSTKPRFHGGQGLSDQLKTMGGRRRGKIRMFRQRNTERPFGPEEDPERPITSLVPLPDEELILLPDFSPEAHTERWSSTNTGHRGSGLSTREYASQILRQRIPLQRAQNMNIEARFGVGGYQHKALTASMDMHNERYRAGPAYYKPFEVEQWVLQNADLFWREFDDIGIRHFRTNHFQRTIGFEDSVTKRHSSPDLRSAWILSQPIDAGVSYRRPPLSLTLKKFDHSKQTFSSENATIDKSSQPLLAGELGAFDIPIDIEPFLALYRQKQSEKMEAVARAKKFGKSKIVIQEEDKPEIEDEPEYDGDIEEYSESDGSVDEEIIQEDLEIDDSSIIRTYDRGLERRNWIETTEQGDQRSSKNQEESSVATSDEQDDILFQALLRDCSQEQESVDHQESIDKESIEQPEVPEYRRDSPPETPVRQIRRPSRQVRHLSRHVRIAADLVSQINDSPASGSRTRPIPVSAYHEEIESPSVELPVPIQDRLSTVRDYVLNQNPDEYEYLVDDEIKHSDEEEIELNKQNVQAALDQEEAKETSIDNTVPGVQSIQTATIQEESDELDVENAESKSQDLNTVTDQQEVRATDTNSRPEHKATVVEQELDAAPESDIVARLTALDYLFDSSSEASGNDNNSVSTELISPRTSSSKAKQPAKPTPELPKLAEDFKKRNSRNGQTGLIPLLLVPEAQQNFSPGLSIVSRHNNYLPADQVNVRSSSSSSASANTPQAVLRPSTSSNQSNTQRRFSIEARAFAMGYVNQHRSYVESMLRQEFDGSQSSQVATPGSASHSREQFERSERNRLRGIPTWWINSNGLQPLLLSSVSRLLLSQAQQQSRSIARIVRRTSLTRLQNQRVSAWNFADQVNQRRGPFGIRILGPEPDWNQVRRDRDAQFARQGIQPAEEVPQPTTPPSLYSGTSSSSQEAQSSLVSPSSHPYQTVVSDDNVESPQVLSNEAQVLNESSLGAAFASDSEDEERSLIAEMSELDSPSSSFFASETRPTSADEPSILGLRGGGVERYSTTRLLAKVSSRLERLLSKAKVKISKKTSKKTKETAQVRGHHHINIDSANQPSELPCNSGNEESKPTTPPRTSAFDDALETPGPSKNEHRIHQPSRANAPDAILLSNGAIIPTSTDGYAVVRKRSAIHIPWVHSTHGDIRRMVEMNLNKALPELPEEEETPSGSVPNSRAFVEKAFKVSAELEKRRQRDSHVGGVI